MRVSSMRFAFLAAVAASCLSGQAMAQAYLIERQPARGAPSASVMHTSSVAGIQPGAYGGGFLELLMTGRDPTPYVRPGVDPRVQHRQPAPPSATRQAPTGAQPSFWEDPMAVREPARQRHAAIAPQSRLDAGIGRAVDPRFHRQEVDYAGRHAPGTVVIDTNDKFLYLVQGNGRALRYGIGVGRPGFEWAGAKSITRKAEWPDWRPPPQMLKRRPDLPRFMAGGEDNPLGARALYLGSSLYRIHGTNEPHTIGQAVSSGCIRMTNEDVMDLYNRVRVGTRVIVM